MAMTTETSPRTIRYCRSCVMPETKPDILFDDDQVCSACRNFASREDVDWDIRKRQLLEIVERYRAHDNTRHDCIVPVSGGKDSHFQLIRLLELGLNPLCVTATTDHLTDIGRRNIENMKSLGVDYIEITTNPVVRRTLNRVALEQVGDISWPEHVSIFTSPVREAVNRRIPLLVWGENPQHEYGGPATASSDQTLTRRWLEEFGGLLGLRVSDLVGRDGIEARHLLEYTYPSDTQLRDVGVTGIFLGYFLPWDGWANAMLASAHGFESWPTVIEGSLVTYENLDNAQTGIHDYFKFLKYGFGRATDLACMQVRRDRISRADAVKLVKMHDGKFPWTYLGVEIEEVLRPIGMTLDEFQSVCDRFTNKRLFVCDRHGVPVRDRDGDLVKVNDDNPD